MKKEENYLSELKEIRQMMEQSSRFLTLSGLAGVLIGLYALIGSFIMYQVLSEKAESVFSVSLGSLNRSLTVQIFSIILVLSLITIFYLTAKRVRRSGKKFWNPGTRLMVISLVIPLLTGGILIIVFVTQSMLHLLPALSLVFYGLALVNAAKFTRHEIFYMGLLQISLGIFASIVPNLGLLFWAFGFGLLHVIYGTVMYIRYEHNSASE